MTQPRWTRSISSAAATGVRMGTMMYIALLASMKQPAMSRITFTMSRKMYLLPPEISMSAELASAAMPVRVRA